jgi:hypothetical protein
MLALSDLNCANFTSKFLLIQQIAGILSALTEEAAARDF